MEIPLQQDAFLKSFLLSGVGFYGTINVFTSPAKDRQELIMVQRSPVLGEQHLVARRAVATRACFPGTPEMHDITAFEP